MKPWRVISSKYERSFEIFNLRTDRALSPRTNKIHDFYIFESLDWVNIIPVTVNKEVVLVRQYRHGIRDITLEIPGGIIEKGDTPEKAAIRELREETGYGKTKMTLLGSVYANPAFLNNKCYTFLAENASPVYEQDQDEKEDIEIVLKAIDEIPELIRQGEITHSLIIAAFYMYFFNKS